MNGNEFWKLYNDIADMGDWLLEKRNYDSPDLRVEMEKKYKHFMKKKEEMHKYLVDKETLFAVMEVNPLMFKWRIIDPLMDLEKPAMGSVHPYHPMFGLKRSTIQFLGGDEPEITLKMDLLIKQQNENNREKMKEMENELKQINSLNEIQAEQHQELDKIEKNLKDIDSKQKIEDGVVSVEERLTNLENDMETVRGRQEERLEREKKELENEMSNVVLLKKTVRDVIRHDSMEMNQKLVTEIAELKQNQQERMSREDQGQNLSAKIEKMEATLAVIKREQLKRLARETQGLQKRTDKEQDEQIESNTIEIKKLKDELRKFRTMN